MRAAGLCDYCLLSERFTLAEHEIDHVIAIKHGGQTVAHESLRKNQRAATPAALSHAGPITSLFKGSIMIFAMNCKSTLSKVAACGALAVLLCQIATGQQPQPLNWTTEQDHQNMMDQLSIKALRPGPSGNEKDPNHANYDEAKANPYGDLPDALTFKSGEKVTSAEQWWNRRRPEIVEDFEREVIGHIPPNVPKVTWAVKSTTDSKAGVFPVVEKQLIGQVDNSAAPSINVDIEMTLVTPGNAKGPVPVMIMFSSAAIRQFIASHPEFKKMMGSDPPSTEQLIAGGWGYALLDTSSIQADNGSGLTKGIIGLTNKGQPRKPEDWGALRAWAWGASRGLDYLETDTSVDAKRIGIEGVSRYGKAALITMAFDTRFAVVLVGSSGEGGTKPHRRNFGEEVENLTGSGEYHWMAGNFLKYGAAQASFGTKNASNLPVDSNELIALCAPRPTFISYGVPEMGDANGLTNKAASWRRWPQALHSGYWVQKTWE